MKVCVECKHCGSQGAEPYLGGIAPAGRGNNGPECNHPEAASRDMVNGKAYCYQERNTNKGCGKQGKLWQTRQA